MNKKKVRVVFSYVLLSNVGCEIIIRGTVSFLTRAFPDCELEFVLPSYDPVEDSALLADLPNVQIVPMLHWKRLVRGVLRKTGQFESHWTPRFSTSEFRNADLFCSVGGDIYTMTSTSLPDEWLGYESFATKRDIPSIMFGANMERFEVVSAADRRRLVDHLRRFKMLAVRDNGTGRYLESYGVTDNVEVHPDPCFCLRPTTIFDRKPIGRIGINLTPILTRDFGNEVVDRFAQIVETMSAMGYEFSFIPHVYSRTGNPEGSDPDALQRLYGALSTQSRAKVEMFEGGISLATVVEALREIDLFIGGRMHGGLNSLTLGKAVCFVGYSQKTRTMVDWLATDSPFSCMSRSYGTVPADEIDVAWVERLIEGHDAWAAADPGGQVIIDTQAYLDGLTARARLSQVVSPSSLLR